LEQYIDCDDDILPFTFKLNDPSGNSYIQNPNAPQPDLCVVKNKYSRTKQQIIDMGYSPENDDKAINPNSYEDDKSTDQ